MEYIQPKNEPINSPYTDGDVAQGIEGSIVPAAAIEHPQRELLAVIEAAGLEADNQDLGQLYKAIRKLCAPSGEIRIWAGTDAPAGFLVCNGQTISRADYADLFRAIGEAHGTGDGSTTFNLPDLTDRFVLGASATREQASAGGSFTKSGATDGHQLTIDEMPRHNHEIVGFGSAHVSDRNPQVIIDDDTNSVVSRRNTENTGGNQPHSHGITDFDVTPPFYALAYIIRT